MMEVRVNVEWHVMLRSFTVATMAKRKKPEEQYFVGLWFILFTRCIYAE